MPAAIEIALEEARAAAGRGEVPVGAAVTAPDGGLLARAGNRVEAWGDPSAHAEMLALRAAAAALGGKWLSGCTLTVTLEPCPMCAQAASLFRVRRLVFGVGAGLPLAILGSLSDGLGRGIDELALKSVLDGFASLAFAASLGWGVAASALSVGVV